MKLQQLHICIGRQWLYAFFLLASVSTLAQAQETMQVARCLPVETRYPITNIYVDENNVKWVTTSKDIFEVRAINLVNVSTLAADEQSLLNLPGGNYDLRWKKSDLEGLLGKDFGKISAGFYDKKKQELWIGTTQAGVFQLKSQPKLQLIATHSNKNSKLKSNYINTILIDDSDRVWIGSQEGMLLGKAGRWSLEEKLFSFERVVTYGSEAWVLGDDFLWKVNSRGAWVPVDVDTRYIEGAMRDIAIDLQGRLWIASEVITMFDPEAKTYSKFGPIEYYTSQYASWIMVDQEDAIWVGTEDKGLYLIEKASAITVNCIVEKESGCNAEKPDAALRVQVTGGTPPYTYAWSGGLSGANPQRIAPDTYTVTVTDSKGKSKVAQAVIANPRFEVQVKAESEERMPGANDGVASVIMASNASEFTFQWDNGETTPTARKLSSGQHSVTVTDKKGCSAVGTVMITQQLAPINIAINLQNPIRCAGTSDAALEVQVSGGKAPFTFKWNDDKLSGGQPKNIAPGTYQLQVTDAAGNSSSAIITIKAPEALSLNTQVQAAASTGNLDGKAAVIAKGGTGSYAYAWSNGETSANAVRLAPGKHSVTVTDANGCSATATVEISENILPLALSIQETRSIRCAGASDAALEVQVSGGKAPFTFKWNDDKLSGGQPKNIAPGTYQLQVTDAAGNSSSAIITIKAPEALSLNTQVQAAASTGNSDGKAAVIAKGGTGSYTYAWSNGETSANAVRLAPGKHSVTVTDANGCSATATVEISENILPLALSIQETRSIRCAGTSDAALEVQVSGGKAPFTFKWNDDKLSGGQPKNIAPGTYQLQVTDAAGNSSSAIITIKAPEALSLNTQVQAAASTGNSDGKAAVIAKGGTGSYTYAWSNGETSANASKLAPGKHSVTVTDANGCSAIATVEISENILPLALSIQETRSIRCAGASDAALEVQVSGGKAPFTFKWNDDKLSGGQISNLRADTYTVTVSDVMGTSQTATFTIREPEPLSIDILKQRGATTETTRDGKASVAGKGGRPTYTVRWSNGETEPDAAQLPMGTHSVTITDANGCKASASFEISKRILPNLTVDMLKSGQSLRVEQLQFDADSTNINEPSRPVLDELFAFLEDNPTLVVEIGGHTNSLPPDEYCDRISAARARAVADYLIEKGINPKRLLSRGYGKRVPIASNDTPEGRRRNQRVEIKFISLADE